MPDPRDRSSPFHRGEITQKAIGECVAPSYAFDGHGALALQLLLVPVLLLLLAILQPRAVVRLQHAVLAAEVSLTEAAVSDNPLGCVLAVFEPAADLLGRAAADGQRHVYCALARDVVACERLLRRAQVLAGEDEPEV